MPSDDLEANPDPQHLALWAEAVCRGFGVTACCHSMGLGASKPHVSSLCFLSAVFCSPVPGQEHHPTLCQCHVALTHRQLSSHTSPPRSQAPWSWFL